MRCPKCSHIFPSPVSTKGGKSRWAHLTPEQRSKQMSEIRNRSKTTTNKPENKTT